MTKKKVLPNISFFRVLKFFFIKLINESIGQEHNDKTHDIQRKWWLVATVYITYKQSIILYIT